MSAGRTAPRAWLALAWLSVWAAGGQAAAGAAQADESLGPRRAPGDFTGSAAFQELRKAGRQILAEQAWDLDGDCKPEAVVVEEGEDGLALAVYRDAGVGDFRLLFRAGPSRASELARLERVKLGDTPALLFDVFEDNPDEAEHFVRLVTVEPVQAPEGAPRIGLRTVFGGGYQVRHPEEEAGRASVRQVDLGGLPIGLELGPADGARWPALWLRTDERRVALPAGSGGPEVWLITGLREEEYGAEGGAYALVAERALDFLPRAAGVVASGPEGAARVLDGDLGTGLALAPGQAAALILELQGEQPVRALRVLPGCASSAGDWDRRGRVGRLTVRFDGGAPLTVELEGPPALDPRVLAQGSLGVPGAPYAHQVLVLLATPVRARRLELRPGIGLAGEGGGACLGELGVHLEGLSRASPPPR
ncbi:MAG TPA: hypothetical protein PK668_26425 [Myxococcota bacterium]|nr:hypothetical protein [Myxococcota bacterium]HRY97064.1 hypothetical protein [Myxococcota bacterium]HSA21455.1 hypothetical protein [Myxococcota bacterium]